MTFVGFLIENPALPALFGLALVVTLHIAVHAFCGDY
jgi:hypothetical protein